MLIAAEEAGYKAFVVKEHYFPSMLGTTMLASNVAKRTIPYGCLCLNNSVGGLNLYAVDAACNMGAKIIFMPTVSAKNHIDHYKGKNFVGAGNMSVPEKPIYYLNDKDELIPEVISILEYLAKGFPDVTLGTGHGTPKEIDTLINAAFDIGVTKILVNHPFHLIDATMEQMQKWASQGAFIELNACMFNDVAPASHHFPAELAAEIISKVGPKQIVVDTDLGQVIYCHPVEGMRLFIDMLKDKCGVDDAQLKIMLIDNPSKLLGLPNN